MKFKVNNVVKFNGRMDKAYFYLDEICEITKMGKIDSFEFLVENGYRDWHLTNVGDELTVLIDSKGYISLLEKSEDQDNSRLIKKLNMLIEEERIMEDVDVLLERKNKIDAKLEILSKQHDQLDDKWRAVSNNISEE